MFNDAKLSCGHSSEDMKMRGKVTEQGLLIPKRLLQGVDEVDIQKRDGIIVVAPVNPRDPVLDLGSAPIRSEIEDASVHHDRYIY